MPRNGADKSRCPSCWKGILKNTGVRQRRGQHGFLFQCGFCGRTMSKERHERLMSHAKQTMPPIAAKGAVRHHAGIIAGVVRDARTRKPIDMAHVCLRGRSTEAFTDRFGRYVLEPVPEHREVEVEFTGPCHAAKVHLFRYGIKSGEVRRLDVILMPFREAARPGSLRKGRHSSGIEGAIKDARGRPIEGIVSVFHHEEMLTTRTNKGGRYRTENLPPGDYMARASAYGYSFGRRWVRVRKDGMTRCDFVLIERKRRGGV